MPTLDWLDRDRAMQVANAVPYRLLETVGSHGDPEAANLLISGDNLDALKALLPLYRGRVKCICIDPPYNTKSAFAHYDDNLEHSQWLSMMYPRLVLLRELLSEDGSIWTTIDDNEGHYLKVLMDEVFGRRNFLASVIWQKLHARNNTAQHFSDDHDFFLVFAKEVNKWRRNKVGRSAASDADFWNPDDDPRGQWRRSDLTASKPYSDGKYSVKGPHGDVFVPRANRYWSISRETFEELAADNRLWWGKTGKTFPFRKRFQSELGDLVPTTVWVHEEVGNNREAKQEITRIFGREDLFGTPKPERLIHRALHIATNPGDLVLDSFLGSGTTAAVAHKMGRQWIGIEMGEQSETYCRPRLKKVVEGEPGGISDAVGWKGGGGFKVMRLGEPVFDELGAINPKVRFATLAAFIWLQETSVPSDAPFVSPLLGIHAGTAFFLLYNGILGDKRPDGGNVLTGAVLKGLKGLLKEGIPMVVYGESCRLGAQRLAEEGVTFKHLPYDVRAR
jgi:adenine-specific DNA-methyltransferase